MLAKYVKWDQIDKVR